MSGSLDNHFLSISQEIEENESPFEFSLLKAEGVENRSRRLLILLKGTNMISLAGVLEESNHLFCHNSVKQNMHLRSCGGLKSVADSIGLDASDVGLAAVLESLGFCMKHRGSETSILEDLEKAINLVHTRRDLVESGRALLDHANKAQNEYERTTNYCLNLAAEQEKTATEHWLQELDVAIGNAKHCLDEECKYVRGLVDEWWEQPASTVVDWVTVDGQNVAAWWNDVKQLKAFHDQQLR